VQRACGARIARRYAARSIPVRRTTKKLHALAPHAAPLAQSTPRRAGRQHVVVRRTQYCQVCGRVVFKVSQGPGHPARCGSRCVLMDVIRLSDGFFIFKVQGHAAVKIQVLLTLP